MKTNEVTNDILPDRANESLDGYSVIQTMAGYNNTVSVWQNEAGSRLVTRTIDASPVDAGSELTKLHPLLNPQRLDYECAILLTLEALQQPVSPCVHHDLGDATTVYEYVNGDLLDYKTYRSQFPEATGEIGRNLGAFLYSLHHTSLEGIGSDLLEVIPGKYDFSNPKDKHAWRLQQSLTYLSETAVFTVAEVDAIKSIAERWLTDAPDSAFSLIHGDLCSNNVFLKPGTFEIKAVIDWVDSAEVDDPLLDLFLAAGWYAFDYDLSDIDDAASLMAFQSVIEGYGQKLDAVDDLQSCLQLFKTYNLLWHLRILAASQIRGQLDTVEEFKGTLASLLMLAE